MYTLSQDFLLAAEALEKERNISKIAFVQAICDAILAAYKKKNISESHDHVKSYFEEETMSIGIFAQLTVVDKVEEEYTQISLEEAKGYLSDVQLGEMVEVDVTPEDFTEYGRIAIQVAKQIIKQRLNEEERKLLQQEYEALKGRVIVGQISRVEQRMDGVGQDVLINLGRVDGIMPPREQIPGHNYKKGERIKVYISDFREHNRRSSIIASQTDEELLLELFRVEVPEIDDGIIEVTAKARIPGRRAKIAVRTTNSDIDPIGACIGSRGSRIQNIITELYNEKIDVIPWSEDPVEFISYALSPTQISEIALYDGQKALVVVPDDQLSLAIGKQGQNVKLASKLTGWKLDIRGESNKDEAPSDNR